ncbi:HPr family phosphocarrier protein [Paenibacillus hemerocallicola]|jgi:phosphotransferase system HPr (HPr) family protein|uniref:Phosphocarrier protein HPr n=1 Tax=Paenibacillus hemerocallicola TaxID=1172614 RepID=A0A5C4SXM5_9BACL|nr:HPr family phosphocarrier protein [Paenibacillus hemerocallicola]TNJ60864.1 HPr family phosphocarrier protein [Paenibacillus hemerocallicola]
MISRELELRNAGGLHARPATFFAETAAKFEAVVTVKFKDKQADGKRVIGLMRLGAKQGDSVTIVADGADEAEAIESLAGFLAHIDG